MLRYGPSCPKPLIEHQMSEGFSALSLAADSPSRSHTPGRKFSITMSHSSASRRTMSTPAGVFMSTTIERLLRLMAR